MSQLPMDDGKIESAARTANLRLREQEPWLRILPSDFQTVLDLGAGAGVHSKWFLDNGRTPVAADRYGEAFEFRDEIEFIQKDLEDMDSSRKFDAIFCSHVVEHFPDPAHSIGRMREMINPGGYIFVVVPPYIPVVVNHHWHTGWNCTQLAMLLAACGFDCSQSTFMEMGLNVCGWGRKVEIEPTKFNLRRSLPLLPAGIRDAFYLQGDDEFIAADFALAGPDGGVRKPVAVHFSMPCLNPQSAFSFSFDDGEWRSLEKSFDSPGINLSTGNFRIVIETDGEAEPGLRIAVGSGGEGGVWANSAEKYLAARPGVNCHEFGPSDFRPIQGTLDFSAVRNISIGGAGVRTRVRLWCLLPDGRSVF